MNSASLPRGISTGSDRPGTNTSSNRLASPATGISSLQPELAHDPLGHAELALAAVDDEQLRRVGELARLARRARSGGRSLLGEVGRQPAGEDLLHRRVVVVARHVDLEPAVLPLVRQPVLEHDHRADVVGALQVGHVVALDAQRRLGQPEVLLQLGERPAAGVVVAGPAQAVAGELLLGVAGDRLQQRPLVAALRHPDLHPRAALQAQPLLVGRRGRRARPARAPASARPAAGPRRTGARGCGRSARPASAPRPCRATKPLRPTTRPRRT